jgi:TolB-like protein/Tfp pilus assembly protein PilF
MTQPDIFLSYNRDDAATAKRFADAFAAEGLNVWWDTALRSGEAYDEVTEAALRGAKAVVVLWSPRSVVSRWVRAEATIADRCKTLVPVTIEPCERPIMFELTQTADLSHWTGDAADRAWLGFLNDVRRFVVRGQEAQPLIAESAVLATPTVQETLKPGQRGDAPSLAVLPFTNRSMLPEDDVFAIGLVEDVISALSQGVDVRVLGASATANLTKSAITDLAALGRQLGVKYLLEGNIRRVGESLRVTAQLLEAETGSVLWTGSFDRPLSELAALQEELVLDLASTLNVEVSNLEVEAALQKPDDLTAWQLLKHAQFAQFSGDPTGNSITFGLAESERALAMAPDYSLANAIAASALASAYVFGVGGDPQDVKSRARSLAERAIQLAPNDAAVLAAAGAALSQIGAWSEGANHIARAIQKAPGSGMAHFWHALVLGNQQKNAEALRHVTTAGRLLPHSHMQRLVFYWKAEFSIRLGQLDEADAYAASLSGGPETPNRSLLRARIALARGDDAGARHQVGLAIGFGVPLARIEMIHANLFPPGPDFDRWQHDLRRLWAESESAP